MIAFGASSPQTGYRIIESRGTYTGGGNYVLFMPSNYTGKTGVVYMHGAGGDEEQIVTTDYDGNLKRIALLLAENGYPVISISGGGAHWGNDTMIADVSNAKSYINSTLGIPGPIGFIGASMGGLVMPWIAQNLSDTAFFVGITPVSDLSNIYPLFSASIDNAYSTYDDEVDGPVHCPDQLAAGGSLAGLAYKSWYGTSDTTVPPATVQAVATSVGVTASTVGVVGGHTGAVANVPPVDVLAFIEGVS